MRVFGSGALPTFSPPATGDYEPICLTSYRIGYGMYDQYGSTGRGGRAAKRLDTLLIYSSRIHEARTIAAKRLTPLM